MDGFIFVDRLKKFAAEQGLIKRSSASRAPVIARLFRAIFSFWSSGADCGIASDRVDRPRRPAKTEETVETINIGVEFYLLSRVIKLCRAAGFCQTELAAIGLESAELISDIIAYENSWARLIAPTIVARSILEITFDEEDYLPERLEKNNKPREFAMVFPHPIRGSRRDESEFVENKNFWHATARKIKIIGLTLKSTRAVLLCILMWH